MKRSTLFLSTAVAFSLVLVSQSKADGHENDISGYIAAGVGAGPDFTGSEDYQAIPLLAGQVDIDNYWVSFMGPKLSANVIDSEQFNAGPVLNYRFGRDDDVENEIVSRLREVDDAFEVGAFASYAIPNVGTKGDKVKFKAEFLHDVNDGHEGFLTDVSASYSRPLSKKLLLTGSVSTTYGSDDYMDAYFSVDANNAARSGLSQFEAEGGFQDMGVSMRANYALSQQWGLFANVGYSHLVGDAADSPIVSGRGEEGQFFTGVGITYRF